MEKGEKTIAYQEPRWWWHHDDRQNILNRSILCSAIYRSLACPFFLSQFSSSIIPASRSVTCTDVTSLPKSHLTGGQIPLSHILYYFFNVFYYNINCRTPHTKATTGTRSSRLVIRSVMAIDVTNQQWFMTSPSSESRNAKDGGDFRLLKHKNWVQTRSVQLSTCYWVVWRQTHLDIRLSIGWFLQGKRTCLHVFCVAAKASITLCLLVARDSLWWRRSRRFSHKVLVTLEIFKIPLWVKFKSIKYMEKHSKESRPKYFARIINSLQPPTGDCKTPRTPPLHVVE